eukprot:TRINITY_DN957_c0_g1_i2.p1 TRINITY_DN957_c0_g1~~TRINITY_DN957_c0_g1_i2.p1  ORF type:complete len:1115 (+),score=222.26 TRINITY_DN957_c0_g1_i2:547-3891(+)
MESNAQAEKSILLFLQKTIGEHLTLDFSGSFSVALDLEGQSAEYIVACTPHNLFILKREMGSQLALEREYHLLELYSVESSPSLLVFTFQKSLLDPNLKGEHKELRSVSISFTPHTIPTLKTLVKKLRANVRIMELSGVKPPVHLQLSPSLIEDLGSPPQLLAGGFPEAYIAVSTLRNMSVSHELIREVIYLANQNSTQLDLSLCPGVDSTSPSKFDFLSIALALRGNSYFKSLVVTNVVQKNVADGIAILLRLNTHLQKIVVRNLSTIFTSEFGDVLMMNKSKKLEVIDISSNVMHESAALSFGKALSVYKYPLTVLNLSNMEHMTPQGIRGIIAGLWSNAALSASLQELDLSHNSMDIKTSNALVSWISNLSKFGNLRRLNVAHTHVVTGELLQALGSLSMSHFSFLDISGNVVWESHFPRVISFLKGATNLSTFKASACGLDAQSMASIIRNFGQHSKEKSLALDLSFNKISRVNLIASALGYIPSLTSLNLSNTLPPLSEAMELLESLPKSVTTLNLSGNFGVPNPEMKKKEQPVMAATESPGVAPKSGAMASLKNSTGFSTSSSSSSPSFPDGNTSPRHKKAQGPLSHSEGGTSPQYKKAQGHALHNDGGTSPRYKKKPEFLTALLNPHTGSVTQPIYEKIGRFLAKSTTLTSLKIEGTEEGRMGANLSYFFEELSNNKTLKHLSIRNQETGDIAWSSLCFALRQNSSLSSLWAIGNNVSYNGFLSLRSMQNVNTHLKDIDVLLPPQFASKDPTLNFPSLEDPLYFPKNWSTGSSSLLPSVQSFGPCPFSPYSEADVDEPAEPVTERKNGHEAGIPAFEPFSVRLQNGANQFGSQKGKEPEKEVLPGKEEEERSSGPLVYLELEISDILVPATFGDPYVVVRLKSQPSNVHFNSREVSVAIINPGGTRAKSRGNNKFLFAIPNNLVSRERINDVLIIQLMCATIEVAKGHFPLNVLTKDTDLKYGLRMHKGGGRVILLFRWYQSFVQKETTEAKQEDLQRRAMTRGSLRLKSMQKGKEWVQINSSDEQKRKWEDIDTSISEGDFDKKEVYEETHEKQKNFLSPDPQTQAEWDAIMLAVSNAPPPPTSEYLPVPTNAKNSSATPEPFTES